MPDYEKMYLLLAAKVADTVEMLTAIQQECEEMHISAADDIADREGLTSK